MKPSAKSHYGMHAILDLAARHGEGAALLRELAQATGSSEKYLEHLLRSLRQAGLVESARGASGGYWLTRPPEEITLLEVVEALEGELSQPPGRCRSGGIINRPCAVLEAWGESTAAMRKVLRKRTLADLLARQRKIDRGAGPPDYSI